jgi:hypothetical protein
VRTRINLSARVYLNIPYPETSLITARDLDLKTFEFLCEGAKRLQDEGVVNYLLTDIALPDTVPVREHKVFSFLKKGRVIAIDITARCVVEDVMDSWLDAWKRVINFLLEEYGYLYINAEYTFITYVATRKSLR